MEMSTAGGAAQDGRTRRIEIRDLPFPPEIEEAGMAHWPRTVRGNLVTLLFVGVALWILVQLSLTLSGVGVWILLAVSAVVASAALAVYWWRRRAETALAIATIDAPSFGDVLRRRNASEGSEL
jgi:hypothetical protein